MHSEKMAQLKLEDGTIIEGKSFGAERVAAGELVFSTAMVGYPESLTDPAYFGQILVITYPIVGNYGVPAESFTNGLIDIFESEKIQVSGLVITDYSHEYSHWNAVKSLGDWLKEHNIPAIYNVDTRELTKTLRDKGTQQAKIIFTNSAEPNSINLDKENLAAIHSCKEVIEYGTGKKLVILVDCGVKHSTIRDLVQRGLKVVRVPWDYDFTQMTYDGVFISSGPGNPTLLGRTIENVKKAISMNKPIFGFAMGSHILGLAAGAKLIKLKPGHRGQNQPVRMTGTENCYISSQNHSYAIDANSLTKEWKQLFESLNDDSCEGIVHESKPFLSANFFPEYLEDSNEKDFFTSLFVEKL